MFLLMEGCMKPRLSKGTVFQKALNKSQNNFYSAWILSKSRNENKNRLSKSHPHYRWRMAGAVVRVRGTRLIEKQKVEPPYCVQYPGRSHARVGGSSSSAGNQGPWEGTAQNPPSYSQTEPSRSHTLSQNQKETWIGKVSSEEGDIWCEEIKELK